MIPVKISIIDLYLFCLVGLSFLNCFGIVGFLDSVSLLRKSAFALLVSACVISAGAIIFALLA